MFDFLKLLIRESNEDSSNQRELILYTKTDSDINILNSTNEAIRETLLDELSKTSSPKTNEMIENNAYLFVCIDSNDNLHLKHRIWIAMANIYNKVILKDFQLIIDGEFSSESIYGLVIKSYEYNFLKKPSTQVKNQLKLKLLKKEDLKSLTIANLQNLARFLGDTPANFMTPRIMTEYIKLLFSDEKISLDILDKRMIQDENMNLILSVSQGSEEDPVFIHAKYFGRNSKDIDIALVGKGVTFDTGGISLKSANEMYKLKQDMMGAAICATVMKIVSALNLNVNLSISLPLVENMPGSKATKPGDVFISKSGLSVEVDNTDAEGRLILADAITFAQKDSPKYLFDIATLTGSVRIALGTVYGGYFTNNEPLSSLIKNCSEETGDLLRRLPLSPFIQNDLECHVADLSNSSKVKGSGAGASYAAEFIKSFVDSNVVWAHFDVSGIRNNHHFKDLFGSQTTGRPIPTIYAIIEKLASQLS